MAVWLHVFAHNRLSDEEDDILAKLQEIEIDPIKILDSVRGITRNYASIKEIYEENRNTIESVILEQSEDEYKEYLAMLNHPYVEKDQLVNQWIADGVEREKKEREKFDDIYKAHCLGKGPITWQKTENKTYYLDLQNRNVGWGDIHITCVNNLIRMVGPGALFGHYGTFQNNLPRPFKEYYHRIFKEIACMFKSDFLLYTHEWAGLEDEEDPDFNLEKLKTQSGWEKNSSDTLQNMESFYLEKIAP